MSDIGDFLQGAARQFPTAVKDANQYEQVARRTAARERGNEIYQQSVEGMNKLREQERILSKGKFVMQISSLPPKTRNAAMKWGVENLGINQSFAEVYKTLGKEQIQFGASLIGKEITAMDLGKATDLGMLPTVERFRELEMQRTEQEYKDALIGKAKSETDVNRFGIESQRRTNETLRGGTEQVRDRSISDFLIGGRSATQPPVTSEQTVDPLQLQNKPPVTSEQTVDPLQLQNKPPALISTRI